MTSAALPVTRLEALARRSEELEALLCDPEVLADAERLTALSRERTQLLPVVEHFAEWRRVARQLSEAQAALDDPELGRLAAEEVPLLTRRLNELERELRVLLLPRDPADEKNVLLEIRAGTGGEEAALFAADLLRMYLRWAERNGWRTELLSQSEASAGGIKEAVVLVRGERVHSRLRHEAGVHRVQRVPATESQGRIHTSTATVAVLPEADEVEVQLDERDLEIHIAASSGPGGQGVNTTNSAVQITHRPSGITVKCQDERSQLKNRARALQVLRSRLLDLERRRREEELRGERRSMVGAGDRSEKIRTYNFPQSRVTDHRIGLTLHQLERMMEGDLDELSQALVAWHEAARLEAAGLT